MARESYESSFNQDLNGGGTTGVPSAVIHTDTNFFGSTSLVAVANEYALEDSSGNGPLLKLNGAAVFAGEFPGGSLIGAARTASRYEIAWRNGGQVFILNLDSHRNHGSESRCPLGSSVAPEC